VLRSFPATAVVFLPNGRGPSPGELLRQPELASTLEKIASGGSRAFYEGNFAKALLKVSAEQGGHFSAEDLAAHHTEVRDPISASYRGLTVYEQPPVSQGHILLEELAILDGFDLAGRSPNDPDVIHLMVEAKKLAFADRARYAGDPRVNAFAAERLLHADFIAQRRRTIDPHRAADAPVPGQLEAAVHDTTSFAVVDAAGNAVAAIQSVFQVWGSGLVVDGTGVLLNNRLCGFNLEPGHPNALAPGKRTVHTLNNYVLTDGEGLALLGGTPGAQQQVQTNMQIISAIIDAGFDIQTAIDLPRWGHTAGLDLTLEPRYEDSVAEELSRLGHHVRWTAPWDGALGRAAVIQRVNSSGVLMGATDLRGEGCALGW
jgi:gamma-glutamyltranspeptidase/glutathione hydrolase